MYYEHIEHCDYLDNTSIYNIMNNLNLKKKLSSFF